MTKNIFPSDMYMDDQTRDIRKRVQSFYDDNISANQRFQDEARMDARIEAGDQHALNELGFNRVLPYLDMYTSNKIKKMVSLVSGIQRRERKSTVVTPSDNGSQQTADQFTKIIYSINNNSNFGEALSDGFQSASTTGLSLLQLWVDYRSDPISGDIKCTVCPFNTFIIDKHFKEADLSDCSAIWKRSYLTEDECHSLMPEYAKEITEVAGAGIGTDDLFPSYAATYLDNSSFLSYDEFYYRDFRTQRILRDELSGEVQEYVGQNIEVLPLILQKNSKLKLREIQVPTVRLALLVNGRVLFDGLTGIDRYPFVPIFGHVSKDVEDMYLRFQSLVRGSRDNQFLFNLMTSLEVEFIQSRLNQGVIYKPTSMIDPEAIKNRDLSAGYALQKKASMDDIRFTAPSEIPQIIPLMREQVAKDIIENDGGNEELLGSASDGNVAGILSSLRQKGGLTVLQPLMDGVDLAQRLAGDIQLDLIQVNYTPGKVKRMIKEEPSAQFYNKTFAKYSCVTEEGVLTATQRQSQFTTMMAMQKSGINIPDVMMIKASTIQNKQEIIEYMENLAKQEAEIQKQENEVNMKLQLATAKLEEATANANNAKASESMAKIEDNRTKAMVNLADANLKDEQAGLDKAKAMKELESIDISQLERFISLVNAVKATEQIDTAQKAESMGGHPDQNVPEGVPRASSGGMTV